MKNKLIIISLLSLIAIIVLGLTLPALSPASNCGGNCAALSVCRQYALVTRIWATNNGGVFNWSNIPESEKRILVALANNHWISESALLISKSEFKVEDSRKSIVAICDKAYDNIPQPTFWNGYKKTPAHAVAYSDRTAGLISPAEFKLLNLSEFMDARNLILSNSISEPVGDKY